MLGRGHAQRSGLWITHSDLGKKANESTYVEGRRHGPYRAWDDAGALRESGQYVKGDKAGTWTRYRDGKTAHTSAWLHGKRHGKAHTFREDGRIKQTVEYAKDRRHGRTTRLYPDGTVERYDTYALDTRTGPAQWFDAEGRVADEGAYLDGKRDGIWHFRSKGRLTRVTSYVAGERHGKELRYPCSKAPKIANTLHWARDKQDGLEVKYRCSGTKASETQYKAGKKHGWARTFTKAGRKVASVWAQGKLLEKKTFHANGKVHKHTLMVRTKDTPGVRKVMTAYDEDGGVQRVVNTPANWHWQRTVRPSEPVMRGATPKKGVILKMLGTSSGKSGTNLIDELSNPERNAKLNAVLADASGVGIGFCGQTLALKTQRVRCTNSTVESLKPLAHLKALTTLDLSGSTRLKTLEGLRGLRLKSLLLQSSRITNLSPLASMPSLEFIDLMGSPVKSLAPLEKLPALKTLMLINTRIPRAQIEAFRVAHPQVQVLDRFPKGAGRR